MSIKNKIEKNLKQLFEKDMRRFEETKKYFFARDADDQDIADCYHQPLYGMASRTFDEIKNLVKELREEYKDTNDTEDGFDLFTTGYPFHEDLSKFLDLKEGYESDTISITKYGNTTETYFYGKTRFDLFNEIIESDTYHSDEWAEIFEEYFL